MLLTFGKTWHDPASTLSQLAGQHGAAVAIAWTRPREVRFKLLAAPKQREGGRQASPAAHDAFIRAVLEHDPHARVRTAKATYFGLDDFNKWNAEQRADNDA